MLRDDEILDRDIPEINLEELAKSDEFEVDMSALAAFDNKAFAMELLSTAKEYVGIDRANNIDQVGRFLALFNLGVKDGSKWMPYCAAGLSFAAAKAFCNLSGIKYNADNALRVFRTVLLTIKNRFFLPSPSCYQMRDVAINQGRYLVNNAANRALVKPGYIVLFQFDSDSLPDHVGIVDSVDSDSVKTVEFNTSDADNTNGGAVARRDRPFRVIQGFIKIY